MKMYVSFFLYSINGHNVINIYLVQWSVYQFEYDPWSRRQSISCIPFYALVIGYHFWMSIISSFCSVYYTIFVLFILYVFSTQRIKIEICFVTLCGWGGIMCYSSVKLDQYLISTSWTHALINPIMYHQLYPFVWPMVISSQSYVSSAAWILSNIITPALPAEILVLVP